MSALFRHHAVDHQQDNRTDHRTNKAGTLTCLTPGFEDRAPVVADLSHNAYGIGRELFAAFRRNVGPATTGAAVVV